MSIQFCVIRNKETGLFHCTTYDEGYEYSEYTRCNAHMTSGWLPLDKLFGDFELNDGCGSITLFESREKAEKYFGSNTTMEILSFAEVDVIVEQLLLGNTSENDSV
jgi:hypothetical protein